jgi:hypothetical protein
MRVGLAAANRKWAGTSMPGTGAGAAAAALPARPRVMIAGRKRQPTIGNNISAWRVSGRAKVP